MTIRFDPQHALAAVPESNFTVNVQGARQTITTVLHHLLLMCQQLLHRVTAVRLYAQGLSYSIEKPA